MVQTNPKRTPRTGGISIQQKLVGLILLLLAVVTGGLAIYFPSRQMADQSVVLGTKGQTYGLLLAKQLEPAVAFDDRQTAREVFDAVAQDSDVLAVALYAEDGRLIEAHGWVDARTEARARGAETISSRTYSDRIGVVAPVVSLEGPKGTLALELSTKPLTETRRRVMRTAILAGLVALFASSVIAWFIGRSLTRRIRRLSGAAAEVAAGNLEQQPIDDPARDEIGHLSRDFNSMLARIRDLIAEMNARAKREEARLEGLVAARTEELDRRNVAIRLLLDSTDQGFLALDLTGCVLGERSRAVDEYFGSVLEGASFAACLGALVPEFRERFEPAWSQVVEDVLPLELTVDQLPKTIAIGDRHFDLGYRPLLDQNDRLRRMLVIVSDVTAEEQRRRAEQDELEVTCLFAKALDDRAGVAGFMQETQRLIGLINRESELTRTQFKQAVHTLKGNSGTYGIATLARTCHELECAMNERSAVGPHIANLRSRWEKISQKLAPLAADHDDFYVDADDHAKLLQAIHDGAPRVDLARMLEGWKVPLLEVQLDRLADQACSLAERLGKAPVTVSVEASDLRLDPEAYPGFWPAFTHAVRNAVDHGLEAAEERELTGKPAMNRIWLRAFTRPGEICIEIEDSGRGVDWAMVRERARARGVPSRTQSDLLEALFQDGLSTRDSVSEISGRGVGLGALRETCIRFGGDVELWTVTGSGTRLRCTLNTDPLAKTRLSLAAG